MALDGAFLSLVKKELDFLAGSRVDKIYQPSREQIIIGLRYKGGSSRLLLSASADSARVHITAADIDNPAVPPMFCMLMRKHLSGAKLLGIRQDGFERILSFDFECTNELGDIVGMTLVCEIMGKYSNIILVNRDGFIVDSIKRVDAGMSRARLVLPKMKYELPPRDSRLMFTRATAEDIADALSEYRSGDISKALVKIFEGISPVVAREWVFYATRGIDTDISQIDENILSRLVFRIKQTAEQFENGKPCYTVLKNRENIPKDFSFINITQYGTIMITQSAESACGTLDYFYEARDTESRIRQRANDLFKLLIGLTERISKRISNQRSELAESEKKEYSKLMGDLLSANIYKVQKGDRSVIVENFYEDGCPQVTIELDERLTPPQNVQKYYHEYKKLVTAERILAEQISKSSEELVYIESVFDSLTRARTDLDIIELRTELAEQGYIRSAKTKGKPPKEQPPLRFRTSDGFSVAVGRNNRQNDRLTLKTAGKSDIWFHTHDITGSHVILFTEGREPSDTAIREAAMLAAYHSRGKNSSQVPVDYTQAKFVKKPGGAKPGMVIFTNNSTVYVKPDEETVNKLREGK
ncbi:MAG: fibronectin/fibrinogen-binding protein [Ruminococcus sp.]|nr:fibronectin/fibrinogen-binding protein [Ruminococcus sp.]